MITITNLLFEEETPQGYSGIKRKDVGQGWGGYIGGLAGVPLGALGGSLIDPVVGTLIGGGIGYGAGSYLGGKIGKNAISNPDDLIDEEKPTHRIGSLMAAHASGPASIGNMVYPGAGDLGAQVYTSFAKEGNANKLGYGNFGKFGNVFFGPILTGLTKPKAMK